MKPRVFLAILIAGVFAAVVVLADPFLLILCGVAPLLWIGLPAALIGFILLAIAFYTGRSLRPAFIVLGIVFGFACFVGLAIPANDFLQERAVVTAKEYPARVAPLLEAYHRAHGTYPASLDQLPSRPSLPRLMKGFGYSTYGNGYSFMFPEPGGWINTWNYDSETGKWHLTD
jgi:hypothetical protein